MSLSSVLDDYARTIAAWLDQARRETAAVQRLQKAVATGNVRDVDKLRQAAQGQADAVRARAQECPELDFDASAYLAPDGEFLSELAAAADQAGVRLKVMDNVVFSYPVTLRAEPDLRAVRIDKRLVATIRPETLAAQLRKLQSREPRSKPEQFIEALFEAYELHQARAGAKTQTDVGLMKLYEVLTILPGAGRDYTPLDFSRDVYFLDASDIDQTRKGYRMSLTASTVSRERGARVVHFVTRGGEVKRYASVKFTPPA